LLDEGFTFYDVASLLNGNGMVSKMPAKFVKQMLCLSLAVSLFTPIKPLHGQELQSLEREGVVVLYEESLRKGAEEAADLYPKAKGDLEDALPWFVGFKPTILLIKKSETFQRLAGSELISAFAVPEKNLMVIDYSKMDTGPFTIEATMKHELCHLMLHHQVDNGNLPKWLDEGLAQWVSQGLAEIVINQKKSLLNETVLKGQFVRIRTLTRRFPVERHSLVLAYEASRSIVEYMIRKYGVDGISRVIQRLKAGDTQETAFSAGLSISLDDLERGWHDALRKRTTWFMYVVNHLYEILFFLAALITIYGFIKAFMRKRSYKDEDEDTGSWD
jgi:hypothetical protein